MALFITALVALLAHSLSILVTPCGWLGWSIGLVVAGLTVCCRRRKAPGEAELDKLLPPATPQPFKVVWHGPLTGQHTATSWYQKSIKDGRGSKRSFNDVLVSSCAWTTRSPG